MRFDTDFKESDVFIEYNSESKYILTYKGVSLSPEDVTCVWNRRPEKITAGNADSSAFDDHYRDEWRHAIDGFFKQISPEKWINFPNYNIAAISKVEQLERAKKLGFKIPETIITQSKDTAVNFILNAPNGAIAKPISHGYICENESVFNIYTSNVDIESCDFSAISSCPTLFQHKIIKQFDIRINYIDGEMDAVKLESKQNDNQILDIRKDNMFGVKYDKFELPSQMQAQLKILINSYSLRFAAIDFCQSVNNELFFLEINPNGQWAWLDIEGVSHFNKKLISAMLA